MKWKDLFYFSHGERRALILLLFLLTGTWIILNYPSNKTTVETSEILIADTIRGNSLPEYEEIKAVPDSSAKKKNISKKKNSSPKKTTPGYIRQEKFPPGTIVELNSADTTILKQIPGIGSTFSNRIIKYRNLLGGFYTVNQLNEVYGIDEERFRDLQKWFFTDTLLIRKININTCSEDELRKHPYINYQQAKAIIKLRKEKGIIQWDNLPFSKSFSEEDVQRLKPYLYENSQILNN